MTILVKKKKSFKDSMEKKEIKAKKEGEKTFLLTKLTSNLPYIQKTIYNLLLKT